MNTLILFPITISKLMLFHTSRSMPTTYSLMHIQNKTFLGHIWVETIQVKDEDQNKKKMHNFTYSQIDVKYTRIL